MKSLMLFWHNPNEKNNPMIFKHLKYLTHTKHLRGKHDQRDHDGRKEEENEVIIGRGVTYEVVSTDNDRGWILRTVPPEGDYVPPELTPQ